MDITEQEARKWANERRENTIREIGYLIDDLEKGKQSLLRGDYYTIGGNPEIRLRQIMEEQYHAEALNRLAKHIAINEKAGS